MIFSLLLLDIDGVLTKNKMYDKDHNCIGKEFNDKDFTAIKKFVACDIAVVFISGDPWNEGMAKKRNIPFYCSKKKDGILDKAQFIPQLEFDYGYKKEDIAFVGDDFFDLDIMKKVGWVFCPKDANSDVINYCNKRYSDDFKVEVPTPWNMITVRSILNKDNPYILNRNGGDGCIDSLFSICTNVFGLKVPEDFDDKVRKIDSREK